jgi:hypothetical protein
MLKPVAILLLCAPLSLPAQISGQPPQIPGQPSQAPGRPPGGNSPLPGDPNAPNDTKPKKEHKSSNKDVQEKLGKALDSKNAAYRGSSIQTQVDDQTVTLTGTVTSSMQRDMALQLARLYGEDRQIVDKMVIQ